MSTVYAVAVADFAMWIIWTPLAVLILIGGTRATWKALFRR